MVIPKCYRKAHQFERFLKTRRQDSLHWQFKFIEDETHNSAPLQGYYAAFKFLYRNWQSGTISNLSDLENHYSRLSNYYGYKIEIPEGEINSLGYQLLFKGKPDESIAVFKKNIEQHPNDPNVYDSMDDAYRVAGKLDLATINYEKVVNLGENKIILMLHRIVTTLSDVIKLINKK